MRREALGAWVLVVAAGAAAAGDTIDASSTTILSGRVDPRDGQVHTVVPLYELVTLSATEVTNAWFDDLALVVSGWGQYDSAAANTDRADAGDLDLAFAEGRALDGRFAWRAGRQILTGGAVRQAQLDGLRLGLRPWRGLGVEAYAGAPVTPRFGTDRGDALGGARLSWRRSVDAEAGLSYVEVLDDGRVSRQDLGLDARFAPARGWLLTGWGSWAIPEARIGEIDLSAAWQARKRLELGVAARRTAPDLFLPRNSIFSVFAEDSRDEAGLWLALQPLTRWRLRGDYQAVVDGEVVGHHAGGKVSSMLGEEHPLSLGVEGRILDLDGEGYQRGRIFAIQRVGSALLATVDGDLVLLDRPMNGRDRSFSATATVGYDLAPAWRIVLVAVAGATPFLERRFEAMAKLAYRASTRIREVEP